MRVGGGGPDAVCFARCVFKLYVSAVLPPVGRVPKAENLGSSGECSVLVLLLLFGGVARAVE